MKRYTTAGQKLTNVLRPLHSIVFSPDSEDETEDIQTEIDNDNTRSILEQRMAEWKDESNLDHWNE